MPRRPTVLGYRHGGLIRGQAGPWRDGRDPWTLEADGDRLYGRGTAHSTGQFSINFAALRRVLQGRAREQGFVPG